MIASKSLIAVLLGFLATAALVFIVSKQYYWWVGFIRDMTSFFTGEDVLSAQPDHQNPAATEQQTDSQDAGDEIK